MSRSFQQMIGSEAFKKRREKTAKIIATGYTTDERRKRYRREDKEGEGYKDAIGRISPSLTNSNERRVSSHIENAEKQAIAAIAALKAIENTKFENLNASI